MHIFAIFIDGIVRFFLADQNRKSRKPKRSADWTLGITVLIRRNFEELLFFSCYFKEFWKKSKTLADNKKQ